MKFLNWFVWFFIFCLVVGSSYGQNGGLAVIAVFVWAVWSIIKGIVFTSRLPGGRKGSVLQGVWVLEKHLRYDHAMKKWEEVPVESKKNYFEFSGNQFRSGDFDKQYCQLPADFSPFFVNGNELVLDSDFFKSADWKWKIQKGKLELTGETKNNKSQFIFCKK
ncbi:MAG: hypothetical protein WC878_07755 [Candidatus Paceibacterota bacterium]|jgi:hypothetical protein